MRHGRGAHKEDKSLHDAPLGATGMAQAILAGMQVRRASFERSLAVPKFEVQLLRLLLSGVLTLIFDCVC